MASCSRSNNCSLILSTAVCDIVSETSSDTRQHLHEALVQVFPINLDQEAPWQHCGTIFPPFSFDYRPSMVGGRSVAMNSRYARADSINAGGLERNGALVSMTDTCPQV